MLPIRTLSFLFVSVAACAADATLTVDVAHPGPAISPTLYGLMTEEINHSYDGGLYAELVQNRAFLDNAEKPDHWAAVGAATVVLDRTAPVNTSALPVSLRLDLPAAGGGVANDGHWGIPVVPGRPCTLSCYVRTGNGFSGPLEARLESADGIKVWARATITGVGATWSKQTVILTPAADAPAGTANRLVISGASAGSVWLSLVSLFPPTYKNRANGNRIDLMEKMAAMRPSFLRLPGGNYLEGDRIADRFPWQSTLAPLENRPGHPGCWKYRSSDGMGLMEMLYWCEDLGIEPLLGVFAGYALKGEVVSDPEGLKPFVQEALDEIEFIIGGPQTTWGAKRVALGHPAPFPLRYVEIGNEDWFDKSKSYDARYAAFHDAIKAQHPQLQLIATMKVKSRRPDLLDDHFYASHVDMLAKADLYDHADRSGPKIFVGEWATTEGTPTPTLRAALSDAAFLTGLERNSDHVLLSAYAPLLTNVNPQAWQWKTNLIGYDALTSVGSPAWHVQCLFASNRGDVVLPATLQSERTLAKPGIPANGPVTVQTQGAQAEVTDLVIDGPAGRLYPSTAAWARGEGTWTIADGHLTQSDEAAADARATIGDDTWTDLHLQAKVRLGNAGGAVTLLARDHSKRAGGFLWLRFNAQQLTLVINSGGESQEIGHWALPDIVGRAIPVDVELKDRRLAIRIDDKINFVRKAEPLTAKTICVSATREKDGGDLLLKLVNAGVAAATEVVLSGAPPLQAEAERTVLAGNPDDRNTLEQPDRVAPRRDHLTIQGPRFNVTLEPFSVTILRLHPTR